PSEDPQYKNIALSFFSADIIDNIGVSKTFTSNINGDVAGANVNIVSKKLFAEQEFSVSGSIGANSLVMANDFYMADGNDLLGTVDNTVPITNLNQYTFTNAFTPRELTGSLLNPSLSVSGGKTFVMGNNDLKLFLVASISGDFNYREGKVAQTNTEGQYRQDLDFQRYDYNATQFALGNLSYGFGNNNSIAYNLIYIHDNKQSVGNYKGFSINAIDDINDVNAYDALIRRQQTNNNTLVVNQLTSEINLSDKFSLDLRGSYNVIQGDEPDRRTNFLIGNGNGEEYVANNSSPAFNHRFYSNLSETEIAANAELAYKIINEASKIVVGYNFRNTNRNFDYTQFNFDHQGTQFVDPANPDEFYNQRSLNFGYFDLETSRGTSSSALTPFFYTGDRQVNSGFVHFVYEVNQDLSVIIGSRFENFYQKVTWSVGADEIRPDIAGDNTSIRDKNYFLPSLNIKYSFSDNDQLRFSSSRTFTFPQFKEVAPFLYEDVNENTFGNPDLVPAQNFNLDLKYEHYFSDGGLIAFSGYYKYIKGSINRILANSAALEMSYFNTGDASVVGAEFEFRNTLFNLSRLSEGSSLNTGVNLAYLYATQNLENNPNSGVQFSPTNPTSGLEGASPFLINADLTFLKEGTRGRMITSAVVLSYFSSRIYSLGVSGQNNVIERGVPTLDFISKISLSNHFSINLNFKNLLNPQYRLTKEIQNTGVDDVLSVYKRGVISSIGFTYKF
ncbi:MAG: TonB-dependent receptor, partial [Cyclobacteriaceae bacterium]|nr:TonB-dependent receptor [Cyclobacteriaceae bacterium]